jgi:hypothetical protein
MIRPLRSGRDRVLPLFARGSEVHGVNLCWSDLGSLLLLEWVDATVMEGVVVLAEEGIIDGTGNVYDDVLFDGSSPSNSDRVEE